MPDYEDMILARQEAIEIMEDACVGDCDHCPFRSRLPGDIDRIDREPRYYCSLFDEV